MIQETVVEVEKMKTREFKVPVTNLPALEENIKALNKKAAKLGTAPNRIVFGARVIEKNQPRNPGDDPTYTEYQFLTVEGEVPVLAGWKFIGKLEPHEAGTIVKSVPGFTIPLHFHTADPMHCEHCGSRRYRKETFIVEKNGTYTQVGRSCLKDFLGHASPEKYASYAEYLHGFNASMDEIERDGYGGRNVEPLTEVVRTVAVALASIRKDGFVGTSYETTKMPTRGAIFEFFFPQPLVRGETRVVLPVTDKEMTDAVLCIQWVKDKAASSTEEFWMNLGKYVSVAAVGGRSYGYIAAAAMMWEKEQGNIVAKKKMADGVKDEPIGPQGAKVVLNAEVIAAHTYQGQSFSYYDSGVRQVLTFKTTEGHLIKMFSSNMSIKKGDMVSINGRLGVCEIEKFDKSPFKGLHVTMMAPRARVATV